MARSDDDTANLTRRRMLAGLGGGLAATSLGKTANAQQATPSGRSPPVDMELILAVDASGSVSERRFLLQRQGYVDAFRNPRVVNAIRSGLAGGIAATMYQWTGPRLHRLTVPWQRLHDAASIEAFARAIAEGPRELFGGGTSISGAIDYGVAHFAQCPWKGARRVIDVSGDGANTSGRPVMRARDEAVAQGIVINGLPILAVEFDLDRHFEEEVIGGPGAFMIAARDFESFGEAVARKLVQEISGGPQGLDAG
jgi:hypothetical protein